MKRLLFFFCFLLWKLPGKALAQCPVITAISTNATNCSNGDTSFFLKPSVFPIDTGNYSYQWTGPQKYTSSDSVAVLVHNNALDNGTYSLIITDSAGCSSAAVDFILDITDQPPAPEITGESMLCAGESLLLTLKNASDYTGQNASYNWTTPFGTVTTTAAELSFSNTTVDFTFAYSVSVTIEDNCSSEPSEAYELRVNPVPARPGIIQNGPLCEGSTLTLGTTPVAGAIYQWTGTNDLDTSTTISSLEIPNVALVDGGDYQLTMIVDGCESSPSPPASLQVFSIPDRPSAENDGPLCLGSDGNILNLRVSDESYQAGFSYIWMDTLSGETIAGPVMTQSAPLVDFSDYRNGEFRFSVIAINAGCASTPSVATVVAINQKGEKAQAGPDQLLCAVDQFSLAAKPPTEGEGRWAQLAGAPVTIVDATDPRTNVKDVITGVNYSFQWSISNGVCNTYSRDTIEVFIGDNSAVAKALPLLELCDSTQVQLMATAASSGNEGRWTQSALQQNMGVFLLNPMDPNTRVSGLQAGNQYLFTWVLSNAACGNFSTASTELIIIDSENSAFAGEDEDICGDNHTFLMATEAEGLWNSEDPDIEILNPEMAVTEVRNLKRGDNVFTWTVNNGSCGTNSDEVVIRFEEAPELRDDQAELKFTPQVVIEVLANDKVPANYILNLQALPGRGRVTLNNDIFTYESDPDFKGTDRFAYEVCNTTCPDVCDLALVSIEVDNQFSCVVPTIITPNNDGVNDEFKIPCLGIGGQFEQNEVSIYNQWGDEVFRASPYRNDWQGTYDSQHLPSGTYYYVIDFGDGEKPRAGFLILER